MGGHTEDSSDAGLCEVSLSSRLRLVSSSKLSSTSVPATDRDDQSAVFPGVWRTVVVGFTLVHEGLPEALVAMARAAKNVAATNITVRSAIPAIGTPPVTTPTEGVSANAQLTDTP